MVETSRLDALIDLLVEAVVREIEVEPKNENAAAPWQASPRREGSTDAVYTDRTAAP